MFVTVRLLKTMYLWLLLAGLCSGSWANVRYDGLEHLSKERQSWFREVIDRIVSTAPRLPYPLVVHVADKDQVNAFAYVSKDDQDGKVAHIVFTTSILDQVMQGDANRLAFVAGHELGHILSGHCETPVDPKQPEFTARVFSRQQEFEADHKGAELALAAGYTMRGTLKGVYTRMADLNLQHTSFEGTSSTHPAWTERMEYLDKEQASLWRAMSAFSNGVLFLAVEQYAAAQRSFERVTREFPACYEAWANLGYACLMQYFDALEPEDLRSFPVGYIVCGGFYVRPQSLEARLRGIDEEMWWKAVGALNEAIRLKPDLALAKANLATAYLLRPNGPDLAKASQLFEEALAAIEKDAGISPIEQAAVLLNASSVDIARGDTKSGMDRLARVEQLVTSFTGRRASNMTAPVVFALAYNRALLLARSAEKSDQLRAFQLLELYLKHAPASSLWWSLAYEEYRKMGKALDKPVATAEQLQRDQMPAFRVMTSVQVKPGVLISIGEPMDEVEQRVGKGERTRAVPDTSLMRIRYPELGIELIGAGQLLAIVLTGDSSTLPLRQQGAGAKVVTLRVGMTEEELEQALADVRYDYRQMLERSVHYRFYPRIGVGVRLQNGKVAEIVVAQLPERSLPF